MKFEIAGAEPRMPEALGGIDSLRGGRWLAASATLHRNPLLRCLTSDLGCSWDWNRGLSASGREVVRVGWGYRPSGEWARSGGEGGFVLFEDGFVRSLKPGNGRGATYSLVADRQGIYYDPSGRSDLVERLRRRSERGGGAGLDGDLARFLELGISKYNWFGAEFREGALDAAMPETGVLVVDQARGDTSLEAGKIGVREFEELVARALAENPGKPVYVRTHPDRVFRARRSCIPEACLSWPRVRVVGADLSPKQVLSRVEKVYVMSSLFGLEALLHGKEVIHGGLGFYGGWGLTRDLRELPGRSGVLTREGLFDVAYREYCLWFDPDTGERCELGRILDHLELQKAMFRKNAHTWQGGAFSSWKRNFFPEFVRSPGGTLLWEKRGAAGVRASKGARSITWGSGAAGAAKTNGAVQVEDGFLRSIGLGAEFRRPLSLVLDERGMYYDAGRESDLEALLRSHAWSDAEVAQGGRLIREVVRRRLSKYNLAGNHDGPADWKVKPGQERILVVGQVESDASLRLGRARYRTNLAFLSAVRKQWPEASVAFKPHPDVMRRLRDGLSEVEALRRNCDVLVEDLDIRPWMDAAEVVHTQTSLAGFEALVLGKRVVCHGVPFYSGWGLTEDRGEVPARRGRKLRLEELVYAALVQYPRYVNPQTGEFTTVFGAMRLLEPGCESMFEPPRLLALLARAKRRLGLYPRCAAHRRRLEEDLRIVRAEANPHPLVSP